MICKTDSKDWIILFGGGGREEVVTMMQQHGHNVIRLLVPMKTSPRLEKSIARLRSVGFPIEAVDRDSAQRVLRNVQGGQILSVGWPYILDRDVLERHKLALNVHPTLLPKYAGPTSGAWVILEGERVSGSTVHVITAEPDGGEILTQSNVIVDTFDTLRSMQRRVYAAEPRLVCETLEMLSMDGIPAWKPEASPDFRAARTPEHSRIDPAKPLLELYDEIRASDPDAFPAHFFLEGQKVCIKLWRDKRLPGEEDMI